MNSVKDIVMKTISSLPVEITEGEALLFNSFPINDVVPVLKNLVNEQTDATLSSRAFDALLKLNEFDKVLYLINLFDESSVDWQLVCCRHLSRFKDKRAVIKLCDIAMNATDPDVRYTAVESLGRIGDKSTIPVLEHVKMHDIGEDYEGFRIADMAGHSIDRIIAKKDD